MSLYQLIDKSFNERQFADVLEYLDAYVMACKLSDLDMRYQIVSQGQNHMGNIHGIVVRSESLHKGFRLDLYENQHLKTQGVFHIHVWHDEVDIKEIKKTLKNKNYKLHLASRGKRLALAIPLKKRLQYKELMDIFKEQLP